MPNLTALVAAHPIRKKPYNAIKFVRVNGHGIPIYRVAQEAREMGAAAALKFAFERFGAHCFHCRTWMPAQPLSHQCTRDHVRSRKDGGGSYLHNLVFACGPCNLGKGGADLISFNIEAGAEYMKALDEHLARCVRALKE